MSQRRGRCITPRGPAVPELINGTNVLLINFLPVVKGCFSGKADGVNAEVGVTLVQAEASKEMIHPGMN